MRALLRLSFPLVPVLVAACSGDVFTSAASGGGAAGATTTGGSGGSGVVAGAGGASVGQGGLPSGDGGSSATGGTGTSGTAGASGADAGGGSAAEGGQGGSASGGAAGTGQGAAAGTTGGSGKGGVGGAAGLGGGAGLGGVGGKGGIGGAGDGPSCAPACQGNTVCNSMGACVPCAQSDRLVFGEGVERFAPPSGWEDAMFPRETNAFGDNALTLRMRRIFGPLNVGNNDQIVRLSIQNGVLGPIVEAPNYVNKPEDDSAALVLPQGYTLGGGAQLTGGYDYFNGDFADVPANYRLTLIDSRRVSLGRRGIYVARWWTSSPSSPTAPGSEGYAQFGFFNTTATVNHSLAFAHEMNANQTRAYWTRRPAADPASEAMKLMTAVVGQPGTIAEVTVQLSGSSPCALSLSEDAEAWITPRGGLLFFTARCGTSARRLYSARIEANPAQLSATAITLGNGVPSAAPLHTPSLSPDQCTLWYSQGGKVYAAPRQ